VSRGCALPYPSAPDSIICDRDPRGVQITALIVASSPDSGLVGRVLLLAQIFDGDLRERVMSVRDAVREEPEEEWAMKALPLVERVGPRRRTARLAGDSD
jgi:hypothetical protein